MAPDRRTRPDLVGLASIRTTATVWVDRPGIRSDIADTPVIVNAVDPNLTATWPGAEQTGARPVTDSVPGILWAATLPDDGPRGGSSAMPNHTRGSRLTYGRQWVRTQGSGCISVGGTDALRMTSGGLL